MDHPQADELVIVWAGNLLSEEGTKGGGLSRYIGESSLPNYPTSARDADERALWYRPSRRGRRAKDA